jgi:hypothetical protein
VHPSGRLNGRGRVGPRAQRQSAATLGGGEEVDWSDADAGDDSIAAGFLALPLVTQLPLAAGDIRIELRRGASAVTISWPAQAAGECAAWLREWLR